MLTSPSTKLSVVMIPPTIRTAPKLISSMSPVIRDSTNTNVQSSVLVVIYSLNINTVSLSG